MRIRLPTPSERIQDPQVKEYLTQLVQALERALDKVQETPYTRDRIVVSNLTKQYTLDSSTGTLGDVRSVLGTLLKDLQTTGVVS